MKLYFTILALVFITICAYTKVLPSYASSTNTATNLMYINMDKITYFLDTNTTFYVLKMDNNDTLVVYKYITNATITNYNSNITKFLNLMKFGTF